MGINYERGPSGPGHAILIRDHNQKQEIQRLKEKIAALEAEKEKRHAAVVACPECRFIWQPHRIMSSDGR